jgi:NitT/TauT family transport system substrate-binding protein
MRSTILAAMLVAFSALGAASAQERVRITSSNDSLLYSPVYVAEAMGYFKQQGIDIDRFVSTSGPNALAALLAGNVDMVMGTGASPMLARKQGGNLKLVANLASQYGVNITVTPQWAAKYKLSPASTYKERLAGLKGIRIGVTGAGGGNDQFVSYLAEQAGLNRARDMTVVALGNGPALIAAYQQGRVDAISISTPTSNLAAHQFGGLLLFNTGSGDVEPLRGFLGAALSARSDWLSKNTELAKKFVAALQSGLDAMHDPNRTEVARNAVQKLVFPKLDPRFFADVWKDTIAGTPKTTLITREMLLQLVDYNNRFSQNKLEATAVDDAYTNDYAVRK